jgi:flagellar biosynthetic protein FliR
MHELIAALGAPWVLAVLLLSVRIGALLLLTPVLHAVPVPLTVRLLLVVALSCVIAMPLAGTDSLDVLHAGGLLQAVLREAAIGATLGLGVLMAFAGFSLAGRLVDLQVGFGIAQVFDPATRSQATVLSATFGLLAAVFFFVVDGHHALLRGIAYSVERFPLGRGASPGAAADPLLRGLAALFSLGFALAAPIVLTLLLVEFALGTVSRNLPQMNMLVMGIPVKIVAGLLALSAWASGFGVPAGRLYAGIYQAWQGWFTLQGPR